jgi:hypothetical protein
MPNDNDPDRQKLAGGAQRLVRSPAQHGVADVLLPDGVRVMSTCRDVEEQFERQPREATEGVTLSILRNLWRQPGHVAGALWSICLQHVDASPFDPSLSHPRCHQCVLRRNPDVPRRLQWPANVGVFGSRIECNQPHAVWALHLIVGLETRGSFRKRFAAI